MTAARSAQLQRTLVVVACGLVGAGAVVIGLRGNPSSTIAVTPSGRPTPAEATEEYGRRLVAHTAELLGQDQADPAKRYTGNRLNCGSCHLSTGTEPGTLTLLQTTEHYPKFSSRAGTDTDIEDRINECMQRSMNGQPLPMDSPEMMAIAAYLRSLGSRYGVMGASAKKSDEPKAFKTPDRAADLDAGKGVFDEKCAACHGTDGAGLAATGGRSKGYVFPPLWGPDSYNDGAGMNRVLTAAKFIKARMPLGQSDLTDDQAFDVAAYVNNQPRPHMPNLEVDYPDKAKKPVDNGYGPYADPFPQDQHRFGPFKPIDDFYAAQKKSATK